MYIDSFLFSPFLSNAICQRWFPQKDTPPRTQHPRSTQRHSASGTGSWSNWNITHRIYINSSAPGRCGCNFKCVIVRRIPIIDFVQHFLVQLPSAECQDPTDKSTLGRVMAWHRQARASWSAGMVLTQKPESSIRRVKTLQSSTIDNILMTAVL